MVARDERNWWGIEFFPNPSQQNSGADKNLFNIQHESQCSDLLKTNGLNWWLRLVVCYENLQQTSRKCSIWIFWDMGSRVFWALFVELQLLKFTYPSVKTRYKTISPHPNCSKSANFQIASVEKKTSKSCSQNHGDRALQVDVGANSHGVVGAGGDPPPDITDFGSWRSGLSAWILLVPDGVVGSTDYRMENKRNFFRWIFFWGEIRFVCFGVSF